MPKTTKTKRTKVVKFDDTLTQRDIDLLNTIHDWGGTLTTLQIALWGWPPNIKRRLTTWRISSAQAEIWLATHPPGYLYDKAEQLRWGLMLLRIEAKTKPSKADMRWVNWRKQLDSAMQRQLSDWLNRLSSLDASQWLHQAIKENLDVPPAYHSRPQLPSLAVSSACKARLQYLTEQGLIEAYEQPTRLSEGRAQACWFLTKQGRSAVAKLRNIKPSQLDWKPAGAYGILHLNHRIAINNFRLAVALACRQKGYQLKRWLDDEQLKRMLRKEKVKLGRRVINRETGEPEHRTEHHTLKIPDGFFWLDMGSGGERHCWFELDNQTLTLQSHDVSKGFMQKIRTMSAFYRSGRYKELFPEAGDSMWYLTMTTGGQQRQANLKQTIEDAVGNSRAADRYWIASTTDIPLTYFGTAVFDSIWYRARQDRLWRLDEQQ